MAYYRRRTTYRKRYGKRKFYGKRRSGYGRYKKLTTSRMHPEFKAYDINQNTDAAITDTGSLYNIPSAIVKGDEGNQRNGEQITLRGFSYRIAVSGDADAIGGSPFRLIIGIDKQANGSTADLSGILTDVTNPVNSPFDIGTVQRYRILRDRVYNMDADDPALFIKGYIKLNTVVKYKYGDADAQTNNFFVALISNRGTEEEPPKATWFYRTRFTDI